MRAESDDHLVRYLLGDLPDDEAERLDERSLTDDEFAMRLRVLENGLVDRYARHEPFDAALERLDRLYRASPYLRNKVRFARALQALSAQGEPRAMPGPIIAAPNRMTWRWTVAAAAMVLIAVVGYLGVRNVALREQLAELDAHRAAAERQVADLQQELEGAREKPAGQRAPLTATVLLTAPRRGLGNDTTTLSLPRGTEQVILRTQVESDSYATFFAAVRDRSTGRSVWRSADIRSETGANDRFVTFTVPASAFAAGWYTLELSGNLAGGSAELVGHYPVRVVLGACPSNRL